MRDPWIIFGILKLWIIIFPTSLAKKLKQERSRVTQLIKERILTKVIWLENLCS